MTRTAALLAAGLALAVVHACLLAACDRVVELEPHPDAGSPPDAGFASDPGLGGGDGGSDGGDLPDGGAGTAPDAI